MSTNSGKYTPWPWEIDRVTKAGVGMTNEQQRLMQEAWIRDAQTKAMFPTVEGRFGEGKPIKPPVIYDDEYPAHRPASVASPNVPNPPARFDYRTQAFQEGRDAALMSQALNPYHRAMRALTDPESLETLGKLAREWEDGYVSNSK